MTEAYLTQKIIRKLRERGCWAIKTHGGMYQTAGLPDIAGCYLGMTFGLEVKLPTNKRGLTEIQSRTLQAIRHAGGQALMVTTVEEALSVLEAIEEILHGRN